MPFSFLHAADLHLDTPFEGLQATDPRLAERLRDASLSAFDALIDEAITRRVDLVVLAGDLYDGAVRGLRAQLRLLRGLQRLSDAGIHSFLAFGNHDPVDEGWSAITAWPERTHLFPADRASTTTLDVRGQAVHVHGTSYPRRQQPDSLLPRFTRPTTPGFHLAVLHANVGAHAGHAAYSPCTVDQLAAMGMHYWALGHIHRAQVLREAGPRIAYPGNLQGRSFKPSERGPKGAVVVTVDGDRIHSEAVDLAPVRFEELELSIDGHDDLGTLTDALAQAAIALLAPGRDVLVRAHLTGRGAVSDTLRRDKGLSDVIAALRDQAPAGLRWMDLADDTAPALDLQAIARRDDLVGAVLQAAQALDATSAAALLRTHDAFRTSGPPAAVDLDDTLVSATLDALHLLLAEEGA